MNIVCMYLNGNWSITLKLPEKMDSYLSIKKTLSIPEGRLQAFKPMADNRLGVSGRDGDHRNNLPAWVNFFQ